MKTLFILSFATLFCLTSIFGQDKSVESGSIVFHSITKKEVTATAVHFESNLNLLKNKLSFSIPTKNFKSGSSSVSSKVNSESVVSFLGAIKSSSKIEKEGRHIVSIKGELTINGVVKPIDFNGLLENKGTNSILKASFLVDGSQFGMEESMKVQFSDKIEVSILVTY